MQIIQLLKYLQKINFLVLYFNIDKKNFTSSFLIMRDIL